MTLELSPPTLSSTKLAKSIIKFIDTTLSLYSPVPKQIHNQMLELQRTLLAGGQKSLEGYLQQLEDKLKNKKHKTGNSLRSTAQIAQIARTSCRNGLNDSEKQNKFNVANIKLNVSENSRKHENSLSTTGQLSKVKIANRFERSEKSLECEDLVKRNPIWGNYEIGRSSSRALLKIIRRDKSVKDKISVSDRSADSTNFNNNKVETLKTSVSQIISIMNGNQNQFKSY